MRRYRPPLQKVRRLLKLLECLQSGHGYQSRDLAEMCGVTRRQIFRDLRVLQESGIAVQYDDVRQSYRVAQPTFLPATELTLDETLSLLLLANGLGNPVHGIPLQQAARDAAVKIMSGLPGHLRQHLGDLTRLVELRAVAPARLDRGRDVLNALYHALQTRQRVRLRYHSLFEQRDIETLLSPYRVFFCRHSWYVVGRSSRERAVRMFNLGRIQHLMPTSERYEIPPRFTLERYLGNAWQFIRERGPDQQVRIRFQPRVATNVSEVLWHRTQELHWNDDGTLDFSVTVSGLNEISWWILGYGDQAEVLEPPELRQLLTERARRMVQIYRRRRHGRRRSGA